MKNRVLFIVAHLDRAGAYPSCFPFSLFFFPIFWACLCLTTEEGTHEWLGLSESTNDENLSFAFLWPNEPKSMPWFSFEQ